MDFHVQQLLSDALHRIETNSLKNDLQPSTNFTSQEAKVGCSYDFHTAPSTTLWMPGTTYALLKDNSNSTSRHLILYNTIIVLSYTGMMNHWRGHRAMMKKGIYDVDLLRKLKSLRAKTPSVNFPILLFFVGASSKLQCSLSSRPVLFTSNSALAQEVKQPSHFRAMQCSQ